MSSELSIGYLCFRWTVISTVTEFLNTIKSDDLKELPVSQSECLLGDTA